MKRFTRVAASVVAAAAAVGAVFFAGQASAQVTTYTFTSPTLNVFFTPSSCTVGDCPVITSATPLKVTLTYANPLAANLSDADGSVGLLQYSVFDGVRTTTGHGSLAAIGGITLTTDGAGALDTYFIYLQRTPDPAYGTGPGVEGRVNEYQLWRGGANLYVNHICDARSAGSVGENPGAGRCGSYSSDVQSGTYRATMGTTAVAVTAGYPPSPPPSVPTLSEWAMILFGTVLAGAAGLMVWRRQQVA